MNNIGNFISYMASFTVAFMFLYLIQDYTIGLIPKFRNIIVFNKVRLKDIIFAMVALVFIYLFVDFVAPYPVRP